MDNERWSVSHQPRTSRTPSSLNIHTTSEKNYHWEKFKPLPGKNPHLMQKRSPERISWSGWWQRYLTPSDVVLSCTRASQRGGEMGSHFHNRSIIMGKRVLVFTMYLQPLCEHWDPVKWKSLSYTFRVRSRQPFRQETHHAPREPICEFIRAIMVGICRVMITYWGNGDVYWHLTVGLMGRTRENWGWGERKGFSQVFSRENCSQPDYFDIYRNNIY